MNKYKASPTNPEVPKSAPRARQKLSIAEIETQLFDKNLKSKLHEQLRLIVY